MITWEYIAGFVDGEGYFGYIPYTNHYKNKKEIKLRNMISFGQKAENGSVILQISKKLKEEGITHCITRDKFKDNPTHTPMMYIRIGNRNEILKFISKTIRYLIVKQDIAKQMQINIETRGNLYEYKKKK